MSSFSDYLETAVLNHVFRNVALTSPTAVYMELYTVTPTDAGGGTVVTGGGYARQQITFGAPADNVISNTVSVEFTATGTDYSAPVIAVGVFDALTGGNLLSWGPITSATVPAGEVLSFNVGEIDISLS